jgi:hypothetical protein
MRQRSSRVHTPKRPVDAIAGFPDHIEAEIKMSKFTRNPRFLALFTAALLSAVALLAGCGGDQGRAPILGGGGMAVLLPPTVTAVAPADHATGVATNNTLITAAFSMPMAPLTGSASFTVTCVAPCVSPAGSVALDATSTIATFTSAANLTASTVYTGTITGATSLNGGVALANPFVWHFTTGLIGSTSHPLVTITVPATTNPGPTMNVPANTAITATFNTDMAPATIKASSFTVTCALPCVSPANAVVSYVVATQTAVFKPAAPLTTGVTYTATVTSAATDLAGNALAGNPATPNVANNYVWTFHTITSAPPGTITVTSENPSVNQTLVCPNATVNATFTVSSGLQMDPTTVNSTTFTVTGPGPAFTPVIASSVGLDPATGLIATFTPQNPLTNGVTYTVTVLSGNNGVKDLAVPANTMLTDFTWNFTAGPGGNQCTAQIAMGKATPFADAATHGVTNTPTAPITHINGNVVLDPNFTCNAVSSPNDGTFGLCAGATPVINGQVITNTFPDTTTADAIEADLNSAFLSTCFPGRPAAACTLSGGTTIAAPTTLGAVTGSAMVLGQNYFTPGVWTSASSIGISNDLTLDAQGNANAVFIFQAGSSLTLTDGSVLVHTRILLINGAKASNVWWSVGSSATIGVQAQFNGNVLSAFDVTLKTGASSCGRMMAGAWTGSISISGQLIFDSNVVSIPGNGCPP